MKDKNGETVKYDEKKVESDQSGTEDTTTKGSKIESEDTLQMIKDALKFAPKKNKKVVAAKKGKVKAGEKPKMDSI